MNRFGDADSFIVRWDRGEEVGAVPGSAPLMISASASAAILTASHPDFFDRIEPGVRALVRRMVIDLGWITYSSCEGHSSRENRPLLLRHVGLLPRTSLELYWQRNALYTAATAVNLETTGSVRISVRDDRLECDSGASHKVLDLVFVPAGGEYAYFSALAEITEIMGQKIGR